MDHLINHQTYESYIEKHFQNEYQSLILPQIRKTTSKPSFKVTPQLKTFEFKNDLFLKRYVKKIDNDFKTYPYGYVPN